MCVCVCVSVSVCPPLDVELKWVALTCAGMGCVVVVTDQIVSIDDYFVSSSTRQGPASPVGLARVQLRAVGGPSVPPLQLGLVLRCGLTVWWVDGERGRGGR